jgi:CRISPR-associated protein Csx10
MRKGLLIELLDPLITSSSSATAGISDVLPYLPGAMLLGATAARGYANGLEKDRAFELFHSGAVKFCDGLPLDEGGNIGLPGPLSLHYPKEKDPWINLVDFSGEDRKIGYEQLRGKAVGANGKAIPVKTSATLRTAIDRSTGRAAQSQLFGYQMLDAGQYFHAAIEAESKESLDQVIYYLLGEGQTSVKLFLGRSKSGEFGRVRISLCDALQLCPKGKNSQHAYLWCLSDLWAYDDFGQSNIAPDAAFFGSSGTIDWSRSFTRNRRFSPYNAHWRKRGVERELIHRGSVFVIENGSFETGVYWFGAGQEMGYGQILVSAEPPLNALKVLDIRPVALPQKSAIPGGKTSKLAVWLEEMTTDANLDVYEDMESLKQHFASAKAIAGYAIGPGPSQWGSLKTILQRNESHTKFLERTRSNDTRGQWGARYDKGDNNTFKDFVQQLIKEKGPEYTALLAKEIRGWLESGGWFDAK